MGRFIALLYGVVAYVIFLISFLYAIGFVGNFVVPKTIDSGSAGSFGQALLINAVLLSLFAIQHTIMARPAFKAWWTKIVSPAIERSTFVLIASLLLLLLFWQWRPMPDVIWNVTGSAGSMILSVVFWMGWLIVLASTFMINHFDLFGLRQVYHHLLGKKTVQPRFTTKMLYNIVRHPIMLGFIIAFWATPLMTVGHLVFAIATTGYIIIGVHFEERDLRVAHGKDYEAYANRVRMLIPLPKKGKDSDPSPSLQRPSA
jgi:protein-S-isoprenylcysteine O-methyltransferase Ste14